MFYKKMICVGLFALSFTCGSLFAQLRLDTRVTRARPNYSNRSKSKGNALDRNPMLGSGGYNASSGGTAVNRAARRDMDTLTRGRGLSDFRANAPSISQTLGSRSRTTGIDDFNRRSVSAADVKTGSRNVYDPKNAREYISRREAVMTTGIVKKSDRLGITPLGGQGGRPDEELLRAKKTRENVYSVNAEGGPRDINRIKSLMILSGDSRLANRVMNSQPGDIPLPTNSREAMQLQNAIQRTDGLYGAYGVTDELQRMTLANQIAGFEQVDDNLARVDARIDTRITEPLAERPLPEDLRTQPLDAEPGQPKKRFNGGQYRYIDSQMNVDKNEDAYYDLLVSLQQQQKASKEAMEQAREKAKKERKENIDRFLNPEKYDPTNPENVLNLARLNPKDAEKQNVVFDKRSRVVVQDIAGSSNDLFNQYMNKAKKSLQLASYYDANMDYKAATLINGRNPLPYLGGALATFGAGEWASAGYKLQAAIDRLPEITNVQLDFKKLLPALDISKQIDAYEHWLMAHETPSYRILLLGMFMQDQNGNMEGAKRHAMALIKAKSAVPPTILKYAQRIAAAKPAKPGK